MLKKLRNHGLTLKSVIAGEGWFAELLAWSYLDDGPVRLC